MIVQQLYTIMQRYKDNVTVMPGVNYTQD